MAKKYALPNMEHEFSIQVKGNESQLNWVGDFKYRRPSIASRGQIDVMRAKLNRDLVSIDPETNLTHTALAHLRFTLIDSPEWWKDSDYGGDLYDNNVIIEIYDKCIDFEKAWSEKVHGGESEDVENAPKKTHTRSKRPVESAS